MTETEMQLKDHGRNWDKSAARRTRTRLNIPLIVGTLAAVAVLVCLGWWRHTSQSATLADAFLAEAERSQQDDEWRLAARLLHDYLILRPSDAQARIRLAEVYDRLALDGVGQVRAIEHYRRAIGLTEPGSDTEARLRRRLAELLLRTERFQEAEAEADILLARGEQSALDTHRVSDDSASELDRADSRTSADEVAWRVKAIAACRQVRPTDRRSVSSAWADLQRALEVLPGDVELAEFALEVMEMLPAHTSLSEAEREKQIDVILDQTVQAAPDNGQAYLLRFRYRGGRSDNETSNGDARDDLQRALALAPDDYEVQLTAGRVALNEAEEARAKGDTDRVPVLASTAREHLSKARDLDARREEAHLALGQLALVQGDTEEAMRLWQAGLDDVQGTGLELRLRIAEAALLIGDASRANAALDEAAHAAGFFTIRSSNAAKLVATTLQNRIAILRARLLLLQNDPASAAALLNQMAVGGADGTDGGSDLISQRDLGEVLYLLGLAQTKMQNWDSAAQAFQKAVQAGVHTGHALAACALAWQRAGHLERAAECYARFAASKDAPPAALIELAELRLQEQIQKPAIARTWTEFDRLLETVQEEHPNDWRVLLLTARRTLAEGGPDATERARDLIGAAETAAPDDRRLWEQLVLLSDALGDVEQADAALRRFKELEPNAEQQLAVEVGLLVQRGQYDRAANLLSEQLRVVDDTRKAAVLNQLWLVELQRGNRMEARRHLLTLHEQSPSDIRFIEQLASLDLQLRRHAEVAEWEERLLRLEGEEGTLWRYFRALRQLADCKDTSDRQFLEAKRHAETVRAMRPAWGSGFALMGRIYAAEGATERAIRAFQEAVAHGDGSLSTYEQLVRQFYLAGHLEEAESYLVHLDSLLPASSRLSQVFISLAARQQQWPLALQRAEDAVRHRPSDALAHVWLGHVLAAQGRMQESEAAYQQAVAVDDGNPIAWQALAYFYHRSDQPQSAGEALENLREKADLPPVQKELLIAKQYVRQGDRQRAKEVLRLAEERFPESAEIRRHRAELLLAEDPELAEQKLREALRLSPGSDETRRMLAVLLAARGGSQRWRESATLMSGVADEELLDSDVRLQAALLVRRGGNANRTRAIQFLERLVRRRAAEARDIVLLAQLYEAEGRTAAARAQYDALVLRSRPQPSHLVQAIDFYLRSEDPAKAEDLLDQLASFAAEGTSSYEQQWAALKARCHLVSEGVESAVQFLEQWTKAGKGAIPEVERSKTAALIALDIGLSSVAEEWLRQIVELDANAYPLLARSLALQDHHREALTICLRHAGDDVSASTVSLVAELLSCGNPSREDFEALRPFLQKAEAQLDEPEALFSLGLIAVLEENNSKAIAFFEAVRKQSPGDVRTLNNLATLYGEEPGKLDAALQCIETAIDIAGPQPVLLDTQGMLQLQQGEVEAAIASLQQAVAVPVPDPRHLFHLAAAYEEADETDRAVDAYRRAGESGLDDQFLTKGDKELLAALDRRFAP